MIISKWLYCVYIEYSNDKKIPNNIREINKNYLQERVGKAFLKKIKLRSVYIIDFNNPKLVSNPDWIVTADKRVKYAFTYDFEIQDEMKYYFTTVFDSTGKLISNQQLPDFKRNNKFDNIISFCKANDIAESDTVLNKPIENISLQYDSDNQNCFIWRIEMAPSRNDKNIVVADNYLLLNANCGKVVERRSKKVIVVINKIYND